MLGSQAIISLALLSLFHVSTAKFQACKPNTWLNLAPIPTPRQEHSTIAINDTTIAVVGGIIPIGDIFDTTDVMQFYDIPSNTWRNMAPTPYKVNHPNVAVVNGKLYLLGGLTNGPEIPSASINWVASADCYVYDPAVDVWRGLEPMPNGTERGSAYMGVHGEMVYLAGGMTVLQPTYQDSLTMVTAFNTTSGKWQRLPPAAADIPEGRQHGVSSIVRDTFYVIGGRWFGQMNVRGTVFKLDLNNQDAGWQTSPGYMPVPRGGLCGDTVGNKVYTFGGEGNPNSINGLFNDTEAFDTTTQQWTKLVPMAVPRHGTHAVAVGNKVYIPGGGLQQDGKPVVINGDVHLFNLSAHFDAYCI